ncbi:2'-5' RNA ligase family protein [Sphingomonas cannabina]|uniref:2'-5' RNA ligase family protein n=1 Tax=Sphingomonas cannabina TaxID=2899123 RepID=UPI001F40A331|nr:2'-5' RNA ligase family protein [Sphingomonas cannabina]UIJ45667.1 2'-5' RNA ligase family protein [Sphingomonas cannabina]
MFQELPGSAPVRYRPFFAIKPADEVLAPIAGMRRTYCGEGTPVRSEHAHITLEIFDDHPRRPDELIAELVAIGNAVEAAAFELMLDRVVGTVRSVALRPGRRSTGLALLQRAIHAEVDRAGLKAREGWSFSPHLTLGYREGEAFSRAVAPVAWQVDEFVLIHSHVGATRHEIVGRWRLMPELPLFQ